MVHVCEKWGPGVRLNFFLLFQGARVNLECFFSKGLVKFQGARVNLECFFPKVWSSFQTSVVPSQLIRQPWE